jgi:hypothetical protein
MDDPDGYFGESVAASYDDPSDRMFQPEAIDPAVSLLAELAGSGRALELAIGTGRIGLPLSQRGVPVHGIELLRAGLLCGPRGLGHLLRRWLNLPPSRHAHRARQVPRSGERREAGWFSAACTVQI